MKIYIAGPMSGIKSFNYPLFYEAAAAIRGGGHEVLCPAEMDSKEMQELCLASETGNFADLGPTKETWGDLLSKDVKIVADEVDGVALLKGWEASRGARLEAFVALSVQKPVYFYSKGVIRKADPKSIMGGIAANVIDQGDVSRYKEGE